MTVYFASKNIKFLNYYFVFVKDMIEYTLKFEIPEIEEVINII